VSNLFYVPGLGRSVKIPIDKSSVLVNILRLFVSLSVAGFFIIASMILLELRPTIKTTARDLHATILEAGLTLRNVREASAEWKRASQNSTATAQHADAVIRDLDKFIKRTDFQLNSQVLPKLGTAIEANSTQLLELEKASRDAIAESNTAMIHITAMIDTARLQLTDPAIAQSLQNIETTSAHLSESSDEATRAITDLRLMADKLRETYLKPVNAWWAVLKEIIGIGGSLAQMIK
jgi:hypothetical protein